MAQAQIQKMAKEKVFPAVYDELKVLLTPYAGQMVVTEDQPGGYSLNTKQWVKPNQPVFFASIKVQKRYVSFYLMPVYAHPELLEDISDDLRRRMQGKSCFNFTQVDPELFAELRELTARGYAAYRHRGWV
jgi:hypothetical protein